MTFKFPIFCDDTGEVCNSYNEYLNSEHWQNFRQRFFNSPYFKNRHKNGCACCNRPHPKLDLHHTTYSRLGREYIDDVIPACRECHEEIHKITKKMVKKGKSEEYVLRYRSWKKLRVKNDKKRKRN